jgi:hypothetical protein
VASVVDPNSFFSDSDSDPQITGIFFGFGSTNYFFRILRLMCSETCMSEKKNFSIEKHKIFLFQVFDF